MTPTRRPAKRVARDASLHPTTVTKLSKDQVGTYPTPGPQYPRGPRPRVVNVTNVNPLVWREALRLAKGDTSRLRILDAETVRVVNQSTRR